MVKDKRKLISTIILFAIALAFGIYLLFSHTNPELGIYISLFALMFLSGSLNMLLPGCMLLVPSIFLIFVYLSNGTAPDLFHIIAAVTLALFIVSNIFPRFFRILLHVIAIAVVIIIFVITFLTSDSPLFDLLIGFGEEIIMFIFSLIAIVINAIAQSVKKNR